MLKIFSARTVVTLLGFFAFLQTSQAQRYTLFAPEAKKECPSVVYDFLESYLFEIDELQKQGADVDQRLRDDKVVFLTGSVASIRSIRHDMAFEITKSDNKYYQVSWKDSDGNMMLDMAFPIQFELLLGKPKAEIEKELRDVFPKMSPFEPLNECPDTLQRQEDGCLMSPLATNYYVESLSTAAYYQVTASNDTVPTFTEEDKWHSSANLFQGHISDISGYSLYVEQNLYGFRKMHYMITLQQWLAYCQAMKLTTYFTVEEERKDGLKALLIAQSEDLGFNHMLSIIIPDDFVSNKKAIFKVSLNAYIPTQNVKNLYQQYVDKPKRTI